MDKQVNFIKITTEFITLGQLLKLTKTTSTGGDVKLFLKTNDILVNNVKEDRRGRKLYKNDEIIINNQKIIIQ